MAETFTFELVSPERLLFSGEVVSVIAPGAEGEFEILKGHAPFLSTLRPGFVKAKLASGETRTLFVQGGFADAGPAGLTILAESAIPAESLKRETLEASIAGFQEALSHAHSDESRYRAETMIAQLREVEAQIG